MKPFYAVLLYLMTVLTVSQALRVTFTEIKTAPLQINNDLLLLADKALKGRGWLRQVGC